MKKFVLTLLFILLAGGGSAGAYWYWHRQSESGPRLRTMPVERGDLVAAVKATGTVEPEEVVDIGAQIAGQIVAFGPDPRDSKRTVDYGSPVEQGTVLALIDDSIYRSELDQARALVRQNEALMRESEANVARAVANVQRAQADRAQLQARLVQAEREWKRNQQLDNRRELVTQTQLDIVEANYQTAQAAISVGQAAIEQAKAELAAAQAAVIKAEATLADAKANLKRAEINLGYCVIKSPVKGVIIDRRVNVGQTVVSSLNSPSLFLIAKDLRRLEVWAAVNEADIGQVRAGQRVTFTVDAYPGQTFHGVVAADQPRLNASLTQNVVTYTVVVETDNSDGKLLPYLTANLKFEVDRKKNVLMVPAAALRWQPSIEQVVPEARAEFARELHAQEQSLGPPVKAPQQRVWVEEGELVRPVAVHVGATDGFRIEVTGDLKEGEPVVVGDAPAESLDTAARSPFAPRIFGNRSRQPQR